MDTCVCGGVVDDEDDPSKHEILQAPPGPDPLLPDMLSVNN